MLSRPAALSRGPIPIERPRQGHMNGLFSTNRRVATTTENARRLKAPMTTTLRRSVDGSRRPPSSLSPPSSTSSTSSASTSPTPALVDALLASVASASADRGSSMSAEERATADALFDELVAAAKAEREEMKAKAESLSSSSSSSSPSSPSSSPSSLSPLDSPFLLGDFDVAYVSTGGKQKGQPAGGRFRSGFGRALFATTAVCQSIFFSENEGNENGEKVDEENKGAEKPPLFVTNKVAFRLAGLVEGSVGLHGRVTRAFPSSDWKRAEEAREGEGEEEEKKGEEEEEILDAVRVDFDPAVVSLLPRSRLFGLFLRIGRPSWVALATPYVDDRVRLGVGSLGSKFLFVRGGEAERQGMRRAGLISESKNGNGSEKTGLGAKLALLSLAAGLLCASFALLLSAWGSGAACWTAVSSSGRSLGGGSGRLLLSVARDAARAAAALGAALVCGRFALGVLSAARGGKGSKKGEQERVGPGGREVVAASSSSS